MTTSTSTSVPSAPSSRQPTGVPQTWKTSARHEHAHEADCPDEISNRWHVVGNGDRGAGPQRIGEVLRRAPWLAHWTRGAGNGHRRRLPARTVLRVSAGGRLSGSGVASGRRGTAPDDALRLPSRRSRLG